MANSLAAHGVSSLTVPPAPLSAELSCGPSCREAPTPLPLRWRSMRQDTGRRAMLAGEAVAAGWISPEITGPIHEPADGRKVLTPQARGSTRFSLRWLE